MSDFETIARRAAETAGFELCGLVAYPFAEVEHFERWIASGYAGEMHYLEARDDAGALKRSRLERALPWARSALVCALNYNPAAPYSTELDSTELDSTEPDSTELDATELAQRSRGWIARYALGGGDYHEELLRRLRAVEAELQAQCGPMQSRCYVDTGPFVERALAQAAGVGWIAKNTCLINQREGSWLFLGVVVTSYEVEAISALPAADRCGSCTRCIDACPTNALIAPYQMDARKCISYLTIEKRGSIDEALRPLMGNNVFGCDICQDVCPWNRKAPVTRVPAFAARGIGRARSGVASVALAGAMARAVSRQSGEAGEVSGIHAQCLYCDGEQRGRAVPCAVARTRGLRGRDHLRARWVGVG